MERGTEKGTRGAKRLSERCKRRGGRKRRM